MPASPPRDADCGYGITQVTDGMRLPGKEKKDEVAKTSKQQEAIALVHGQHRLPPGGRYRGRTPPVGGGGCVQCFF